MRVIALDFDGVMNSSTFIKRRLEEKSEEGLDWLDRTADIDPAAVVHLNAIVKQTGAKVVISSSWRLMYSIEEIQRLLDNVGFQGEVIGATPRYVDSTWESGRYATRADEIRAWLDVHPEVDSFVILDDDGLGERFGASSLDHRFIQTNGEYGLQLEHVEKAVELLGA